MQCPYCAEQIKDQANYCRYCGHDLSFFKITEPMLESISSLEDQVSSLEDQVSFLKDQISELAASDHKLSGTPQASIKVPSSSPQAILPFRPHVSAVGWLALVLIASLITSQVLYEVLIHAHMSANEAMQIIHNNFLGWDLDWTDILFIGAPLVAGGWLRIKQRQKHLKSYIVLGVFVGVVAETVMIFLVSTVLHPPFFTVEDEIVNGSVPLEDLLTLIRGFGVNVAVITMLLVSGGMFGGLIDAWKSNRSITEDATLSKKVVKKVVPQDSQLFDKVIKVLTVFYPSTLAFAGTLLVSFLGPK